VIRFSAFLVVVAVGLLVAGVVTSKLTLVYVAIGVSGVALLALAIGALVKRKELFGPSTSAEPQLARPEPAAVPVSAGQPATQAAPWQATVPAAPAWDVPRRPAAFTPRPPAGPPSPTPAGPPPGTGTWEWIPDAPATQEIPRITAATLAVQALARDEPVPDEPAVHDQPEAEHQPQDSPPVEETQQLPDENATPDADATPAPSEAAEPAPATPEAPDPVDLEREVTVVPGVPRYHTPHCLLIRFMGEGDLEKMTLGAARQAGCTPCRACLPDQADADPELGPPEPERQAEIVLDMLPPRTRPALEHLDRQHLAGDQPRVLGQGHDHVRVL
jgi:hypothetical protein